VQIDSLLRNTVKNFHDNVLGFTDYFITYVLLSFVQFSVLFFLSLAFNNILPEYVVSNPRNIFGLWLLIGYYVSISNAFALISAILLRLMYNYISEVHKIAPYDKKEFIMFITFSLVYIYYEVFFPFEVL